MTERNEHLLDSGIDSILGRARILGAMSREGQGVFVEDLVSQILDNDPAMAEVVGHLLTGSPTLDAKRVGEDLVALARSRPTLAVDRREPIDLIVVAPKVTEEEAVLAALGISRTHAVWSPRLHQHGYLGEVDGFSTLVCSPKRDGNTNMVIYCHDWLRGWAPTLGALVGMAGGREHHVALGDVVVARQIFDYQFWRKTIDERNRPVDEPRFLTYPVRDSLLTNLPGLDTAAWRDDMKRAFESATTGASRNYALSASAVKAWPVGVKFSGLLSGSWLIENGTIPKLAKRIHDRAVAVEMEGAGFAATFDSHDVPWLSFRGIADMGGHPSFPRTPSSRLPTEGSPRKSRPKNWQFPATFAAASLLRASLPEINVLFDKPSSR